MGSPASDGPPLVPPSPTGTEKFEDAIASLFVSSRGIRAGWRFLIFVAITLASAGILLIVTVASGTLHLKGGQPAASSFTASSVVLQEAILVISMFFAAFIMSKVEKRAMDTYGLPWKQAFGGRFWQGVLWGFAAISVTMLLIAALHGFTLGSVALSGSTLFKYATIWAVVFLLTGFSEEFLFRGYSQFTLTQGMGFWPAAILLSLL